MTPVVNYEESPEHIEKNASKLKKKKLTIIGA